MTARPPFLHRLPLAERSYVLRELSTETTGGLLLLAATVVALLWANSPAADAYRDLADVTVGPSALHLDLTLATWASEGLLAVFFLVAGLELKRELVVGELSRPADAVLPVAAALGGILTPALLFLAFTVGAPEARSGWAVPVATDIAFALAVLAVLGSGLPAALRAFLLTLAVVDDLVAIGIIAIGYTESLALWPLAGATVLLALVAWLQHRRVRTWWLYVPVGLAIWGLVHASGVHATVAGVAIGLLVRVRRDPGEAQSPAPRLEHRLHPYSAYVAVPVFALFAAGVSVTEAGGFLDTVTSRLSLAVVGALVLGKAVGVLVGAYGAARFTRARLAPGLGWADVAAVAVLSGMGFTVSLLIAELAFAGSATLLAEAKTGVLAGSLTAAVIAGLLLRQRAAGHRRYAESDPDDSDAGAEESTQRD